MKKVPKLRHVNKQTRKKRWEKWEKAEVNQDRGHTELEEFHPPPHARNSYVKLWYALEGPQMPWVERPTWPGPCKTIPHNTLNWGRLIKSYNQEQTGIFFPKTRITFFSKSPPVLHWIAWGSHTTECLLSREILLPGSYQALSALNSLSCLHKEPLPASQHPPGYTKVTTIQPTLFCSWPGIIIPDIWRLRSRDP